MNIRLVQQVLLKGRLNTFREIYKDIKSDIKPCKGDMIYDTAWKDPYEYEVVEVRIDYDSETCYVILPMIEIEADDEKYIKQYIDMTKLHNWKCNTI